MDQPTEPDESRPEVLVAATLYLMTHYMRSGSPRLAQCVSRHMQCLATHAGSDPTIRDVCAALHGAWAQAATFPPPRPHVGPPGSVPDPALLH